ncbi:MAG: ABC transporter ATP-binding protein, partial [Nitrososphaerales archaeon]
VALVPEGRGLFPHMTVYENLLMGAYSQRQNSKETLSWVYEIFPILKERANQQASTLSGGEQQMLAIGRSLMSNPKFLMLDEPSQGLGPKIVLKILDTIKQINSRGVTIMLVEQSVPFALELANKVYVIENGKIVHSGRSEEIRNLEDVKRAYLGI